MSQSTDPAGTGRPQVVFAITHTEPGGLREIWQDVALGLRGEGYRTGWVALYPRDGEIAEAKREGWHFLSAGAPRGIIAGLGLLRAAVGWLRETRPEVVITGMPLCNVLFALACKLAGGRTKVILSHHTASFTYHPLLNRLDRWTGCLSTVLSIISVSDAVGASFAAWPARYRAKQCTIHNSLPERIERLADTVVATRTGPWSGENRIIAVGRLSRQKNHPQLIRAMAHLPQAQLEIIGAGEDEAALRALIAELGLGEQVTLSGQMAREETLRRVARADVFAQVSLFEGHSLALIEAARLGLPLVVSQVPEQIEGISDAQGQPCGIAVPLGDDRALAEALLGLISDAQTYALWTQRAIRLGQMRSSRALIGRYAALLARHGLLPDRQEQVSQISAMKDTKTWQA